MSYAAISLGLFILVFTHFLFNAPKDAPEPPTPTSTGFCQMVDPAAAPTFQAPADNITKNGSSTDEDEETGSNRHAFSSTNTTYQLIREKVPLSKRDTKGKKDNFVDSSEHFDTAEKLNINIPEVDTTKFRVFFPEISGEISIEGTLPSRTRGGDRDLLYFIDYGLVFLLYLNEDEEFTEYTGNTAQGGQEIFYLADIYRDIGSGRPELPPDTFQCDTTAGANASWGRQVIMPEQQESTSASQLQMEYFIFDASGQVANGWGIHCKPAVYLYPPKKQLVNVKVHPSGFLTYVDPPYDKEKGWTVWANPNGQLQTSNESRATSHDYLYFESKVPDQIINKPAKGWVREYSELEQLYKEVLPKLGLNEKQAQDFIDYWKKALPKSPYYFVGIIDQDNVNEIERLEITPKPDSINRVRVYFERLDSPRAVETPVLKSNESRATNSEFRVVEWGGMVKNDPNHPFTCSQ